MACERYDYSKRTQHQNKIGFEISYSRDLVLTSTTPETVFTHLNPSPSLLLLTPLIPTPPPSPPFSLHAQRSETSNSYLSLPSRSHIFPSPKAPGFAARIASKHAVAIGRSAIMTCNNPYVDCCPRKMFLLCR